MNHLIGLLCSCIVTGFVFFEVMGSLYERKYVGNKFVYKLAFLLYVVLNIAVVCLQNPILNLGYSALALCVLSMSLFKVYGKSIFINSGILIIYLAIVDVIVTTIFSTLLDFTIYETLQNPKYYLLSSIGNAITILCTYRLIIQILQRCQVSKASKILHFYMMFLMIFEFWILSYYMRLDVIHDIPLLLMSVGFVVLDAGVLYLYKKMSENALLEKRAELIEKQLEMTVKYYEDFQENYERTEKVLHDTKKHLRVIDDLKNIDSSMVKEYKEEVLQSLNNIHQQFQCENKIVSAIIWNKLQICEQQGIDFQINLPDISFDFMSRMEITALFANLLDNAIEACQSSEAEKKMIVLRIHCFKEHVVIKLKNTIGTLPRFRDGKLATTKKGHLGVGMSILENLANKYCGSINYEYTEDFFVTNIILFTNNKV